MQKQINITQWKAALLYKIDPKMGKNNISCLGVSHVIISEQERKNSNLQAFLLNFQNSSFFVYIA